MNKARIVSLGMHVPEQVMHNRDFEKIVDTSDEWIYTRTGIRQRHIAPKSDLDVTSASLGAVAARQALEKSPFEAEQIDVVLCATCTPDNFFPSNACKIQYEIGATNAWGMDISAACSGFLFGLQQAKALIESATARTVLLVGAELISRALDWSDRSTCILFGDGAGAAVIAADTAVGIEACHIRSDPSLADILRLPAWDTTNSLYMNGREVFKYAVKMMTESVQTVCKESGCSTQDIDLLVPHQANVRIISAAAKALGLPMEKVATNLENYGNTSAASIPIALYESVQQGKIGPGAKIVCTAVGGGITYGAALAHW